MKLYYWDGKNFGDEINKHIWKELLPGVIDVEQHFNRQTDKNSDLFLGIGTLLNDQVPSNNNKIIFGSGVGYGTPNVDTKWDIRFVRGPLSAESLTSTPVKYITDPAILLQKIIDTSSINKKYDFGIMPHHESIPNANWRKICEEMNVKFLDPTADYETTLRELLSCRKIIAEAMHGAIVADTFDIPWLAINLNSHINTFKWEDWCQSLNVSYSPLTVAGPSTMLKKRIPKILRPLAKIYNNFVLKKTIKHAKLSKSYSLSSSLIRSEKIKQIEIEIEKFAKDHN